MLKKIVLSSALVIIVGLLVFGAVNRTLAKNSNETRNSSGLGQGSYDESLLPVEGNGHNGNVQPAEQVNLPPADTSELSAVETAALLYMREEEKLAGDVYSTLYAAWGLPIFQNISQSEQTHTQAVKTLLDRYNLSDPASSTVGVFTNQDLQALYNQLVARGSQSLSEALKVGAAIEEIDILDLENRLTQINHADIQQVFDNLLQGSYNHLSSFVSTLSTQTGEVYQPQYLSNEAYQAILSTSLTTGNGYRGGGQSVDGQTGTGLGVGGQAGAGQGAGGQAGTGQGGGYRGGRP